MLLVWYKGQIYFPPSLVFLFNSHFFLETFFKLNPAAPFISLIRFKRSSIDCPYSIIVNCFIVQIIRCISTMGVAFSSSNSSNYIYPAIQSSYPPTRIYRIQVYKICRLVKQLTEDEGKPRGVRVIIKTNPIPAVGFQPLHAIMALIHGQLVPSLYFDRHTLPSVCIPAKSFGVETSSYAFGRQNIDFFSPTFHAQVQ